jgi:hypothetical protein
MSTLGGPPNVAVSPSVRVVAAPRAEVAVVVIPAVVVERLKRRGDMGTPLRNWGWVEKLVEKWSTFHARTRFGSVALRRERTRRQIITGIILFRGIRSWVGVSEG